MLTAEELQLFDDQGFLLRKGLVPIEWIQQVDREIENIHVRMANHPDERVHVSWEVYDDEEHPRRIKQLMHSEVISPTLNRILRCDPMLDIVESIIGPDISLYHSKLLLKAANDGTAIPWHQDYAYWKRDDNRPLMVNGQLAIDAATLDNGCIQFVPGSHKAGLQEHERKQQTFGVFLPGHYQERSDAVAVKMDPGDCIFFGALVVHGSAANRSPQDRRMNTFAYNVTGNSFGQCREVLRGKPMQTGGAE